MTLSITETVGARIRRLRKERRVPWCRIAACTRMSADYVRQVERNEHQPGLFLATELAKLFDVSLDYLACRTDHENNPYVRR